MARDTGAYAQDISVGFLKTVSREILLSLLVISLFMRNLEAANIII
jgi:hypothetical protein